VVYECVWRGICRGRQLRGAERSHRRMGHRGRRAANRYQHRVTGHQVGLLRR